MDWSDHQPQQYVSCGHVWHVTCQIFNVDSTANRVDDDVLWNINALDNDALISIATLREPRRSNTLWCVHVTYNEYVVMCARSVQGMHCGVHVAYNECAAMWTRDIQRMRCRVNRQRRPVITLNGCKYEYYHWDMIFNISCYWTSDQSNNAIILVFFRFNRIEYAPLS